MKEQENSENVIEESEMKRKKKERMMEKNQIDNIQKEWQLKLS